MAAIKDKRVRDSTIKKIETVMEKLGLDLGHEDFKETPERFLRMLEEMTEGQSDDLPFNFATFQTTNNQLVTVGPVTVNSLCPHHLLPYFGHVYLGYVPSSLCVGLSKIPRLLKHRACFPQKQEDFIESVATEFEQLLKPRGLIVLMKAVHTCMRCRGALDSTSTTTTTAIRGLRGHEIRDEFMQSILIPAIN